MSFELCVAVIDALIRHTDRETDIDGIDGIDGSDGTTADRKLP